jgi:hypothetical protein
MWNSIENAPALGFSLLPKLPSAGAFPIQPQDFNAPTPSTSLPDGRDPGAIQKSSIETLFREAGSLLPPALAYYGDQK